MENNRNDRAEIRSTRSKKKPFSVRYVANNGEPLAPSQTLTTHNNAKKNIVAMIKLANGTQMRVKDITIGQWYTVGVNGCISDASAIL